MAVKPVIDLDAHDPVSHRWCRTGTPNRRPAGQDLRLPLVQQTSAAVRQGPLGPPQSGGPTCPCNLAPLCRRHHRIKTHGAWTYRTIEPGTYLWTSKHGYQYLRDTGGTLDVSSDRPRPPD